MEQNVEQRTWRLLGEPRINVLLLNLALDQRWPLLREGTAPNLVD
ncbi:MAG TPA: potassium-transporting ATPase subunit C [Candidatus Krumholzibacteria bacterium]|nr:potassium-transporting ATPase subunit C [Candidatus Krumholzibacteria bacterium]